MFVYDLSLHHKAKLPPLQNWLNPEFVGQGDNIVANVIGKPAQDPKNFRADFPDYCYQYDELQKFKQKLNKEKAALDEINANKDSAKKYNMINSLIRPYDLLRGHHGILVQEFGAEIVTNAWLKMYENMAFLDPLLEKLRKAKDKHFYSMHLAEAPGNFILAINHYLRTNFPEIEWKWLANSYRDLYASNTHYLSDTYGLIRQRNRNWIFGADGDGDITSPANIVSFKQAACEYLHDKVHLLTSDVKYLPQFINYDEEENYNVPVHFGHTLCALNTLASDGIAILKEFTFFEAPSVALLYLLANCFRKLNIIKPLTSKAGNSEVYIVGTGYKAGLTELQSDRLFKVMNYIRYLNTEQGAPALFLREDIPDEFVNRVTEFSHKLMQTQIAELKHSVEAYHKYKDNTANIAREYQQIREKKSREWIKLQKIKPLDVRDHMIATKQDYKKRFSAPRK